jgi:hypothetical protein
MLNVDTDATCVQLLAFEESEEEFVAEQLAPASTKMRARHAIASSKDGGPNADILVLIWWKICRRDSLACYCSRGRHPLHCHRADRTEFERMVPSRSVQLPSTRQGAKTLSFFARKVPKYERLCFPFD